MHADPHAGNLLATRPVSTTGGSTAGGVTAEQRSGPAAVQLAFLDFGLLVKVPPSSSEVCLGGWVTHGLLCVCRLWQAGDNCGRQKILIRRKNINKVTEGREDRCKRKYLRWSLIIGWMKL